MKTSVKKDVHTGDQPVRVLKHNLTTRLVERNEEYIRELLSDFRLDKQIKYHAAKLPLVDGQTPFVDDSGTINIHESYLSFIWIVSYFFTVLHEEGLAIPDRINRGLPVAKEHTPDIIPNATELFDYAKSLIRIYDDWNKEVLPNPEFYDEDSNEGWYVVRTNDIYVEVLNFILYHETAHAELEHIKKIQKENLKGDSQKLLEIEADTRAIELILSSGRNQNISELAIIIGLASMLFFSNSLQGGKKHPNIDTRLENAIKLFNPDDESPVWSMLAIFMKVWNEQFNLNLKIKSEYHNYKQLFYDYLNQVK